MTNMIILFRCCEAGDRTQDLRVMSPTSYRCSTSHCKYTAKKLSGKIISKIITFAAVLYQRTKYFSEFPGVPIPPQADEAEIIPAT